MKASRARDELRSWCGSQSGSLEERDVDGDETGLVCSVGGDELGFWSTDGILTGLSLESEGDISHDEIYLPIRESGWVDSDGDVLHVDRPGDSLEFS